MNRILIGLAAALVIPAAFAATPAAPASHSASKAIDYAARCTSLAGQWKTAESTNASNAKLGQAKADAEKAAKLCGSTKASDHKKGAVDYEAALKLLGVTPT